MILNIGHRGFGVHSMENTIVSFENAIESKLDMIELDVRLTKDEEVVVFHDKGLKRLASISSKLSDMTYETLRQVHIFSGGYKIADIRAYIPTLDEVLSLCKDKIQVNIEIKEEKKSDMILVQKVIDRVTKHEMRDQIVLSSFSKRALKLARELDPLVRCGYVFHSKTNNTRLFLNDLSLYSIHPYKYMVSKRLMRMARERSVKVYPWTVNSEKLMRKLISIGVDGIITNYPLRLANLLLIHSMHSAVSESDSRVI